MKICKRCLFDKEDDEFGKCKKCDSKGLDSYCRGCRTVLATERQRTKKGLIFKIYNQQKNSSKKRGHYPPTYSRDELYDWIFSKPLFHKIYDNWKRLDFQKEYIPSIDRKNDDFGYTIANIKLCSWKENNSHGHYNRVNAISKQGERNLLIELLDDRGEVIESFKSLSEAHEITKVSKYYIKLSCDLSIELENKIKFQYKKDLK